MRFVDAQPVLCAIYAHSSEGDNGDAVPWHGLISDADSIEKFKEFSERARECCDVLSDESYCGD